MKYSFSEHYETTVANVHYSVFVTGVRSQDEYDSDTWYTQINNISIVDEMDVIIDDDHEDFDDILEDAMNREYDAPQDYDYCSES